MDGLETSLKNGSMKNIFSKKYYLNLVLIFFFQKKKDFSFLKINFYFRSILLFITGP